MLTNCPADERVRNPTQRSPTLFARINKTAYGNLAPVAPEHGHCVRLRLDRVTYW